MQNYGRRHLTVKNPKLEETVSNENTNVPKENMNGNPDDILVNALSDKKAPAVDLTDESMGTPANSPVITISSDDDADDCPKRKKSKVGDTAIYCLDKGSGGLIIESDRSDEDSVQSDDRRFITDGESGSDDIDNYRNIGREISEENDDKFFERYMNIERQKFFFLNNYFVTDMLQLMMRMLLTLTRSSKM